MFDHIRIFNRQMNSHELGLKQAMEFDPRVVVTKLQVRRFIKADRCSISRSHINKWCDGIGYLLLVFEFVCPCGDVRKEIMYIQSNWKHSDRYQRLTARLKDYTYNHLHEEGLI